MLPCLIFLKENHSCQFKVLSFITAVDYPEKERRFKLVYLLLSHEFNSRVLIDFFINENEIITSLTSLFPSSNFVAAVLDSSARLATCAQANVLDGPLGEVGLIGFSTLFVCVCSSSLAFRSPWQKV